MTDLSNLPSDEASTLRLLASGKTAADVADLLSLDVEAVKGRALLGADKLAPEESAKLAESERSRVLSVLFGETAADPLLKSSPAAQDYFSAIQQGLGITAIETQSIGTPAPPKQEPKAPSKTEARSNGLGEPKQGADRGRGRLLLALAGLAVVGVVAVIVISGGGSDSKPSRSASATTTSQSATDGWTIRNRFTLKAVDGGSGKALAGVETKGEASALLIAGNGLTPSTTVGIWLVGGGSTGLIGFQNVNAKGQFSAVGPLPKNLQKADTVVVTRETVKQGQAVPKTPGPVILSSPFSLS
jgi:hypothetical protein